MLYFTLEAMRKMLIYYFSSTALASMNRWGSWCCMCADHQIWSVKGENSDNLGEAELP